MHSGSRITKLGWALIALAVIALIFTFTGSSVLQIIGFVVLVAIVIVMASDQLTVRFGRYGHMTSGRADTAPTGASTRDAFTGFDRPEDREEAWRRAEAERRAGSPEGRPTTAAERDEAARREAAQREATLEREAARYRERLRQHPEA